MSVILYNSKFIMKKMRLRKVLIIPYKMFLRSYLRNNRIISLIGSGRGRFFGLGGALLQSW